MAEDLKLADGTRKATGSAWFDYLELLDPIRPGLFRYCRRLTGDVWDAEDLVQDTLIQGFAKLAAVHHQVANPQAYLLRIASNLWVDRIRRSAAESRAIDREAGDPTRPASGAPPADRGLAVRDAGAVLLQELAPRERATLLLKEVFELPMESIAAILSTSVGAVKSALHRGRGRLRDEMKDTTSSRPAPKPEVIERFVERYNARDLPGLLELMLDGATIDMYGYVYEAGRDAFAREDGWFHHNFYDFDGSPSSAVWELAEFRGEPVVLVLYGPREGRVVGSVMRLDATEDAISRIRVYALCPDVVAEVAEELGRPTSGVRMYRAPFRGDPAS